MKNPKPSKLSNISRSIFLSASVVLFQNTNAQVFTKITSGSIVNEANNSYFATWGDFDKDGDLDLYHSLFFAAPNNPNGNNLMFQNNCNGDFTQVKNIPGGLVTDALIPVNNNISSYWIDYDNDGDLDMYAAANNLYENNGNGSFTKVNKVITNLPSGIRGIGLPVFADYNNDGYLDVYTGLQSIYKNNKHGDYDKLDVLPFTNARSAQVATVAWADYDNDGFMDMYVVNTGSFNSAGNFIGFGTNYLYHNNGNGTFSEVTSNPSMIESFWSYGCAWADVDNDLDLDLLVEDIQAASGRRLYINNGNGVFTKVVTGDIATIRSSGQAGFAFGDYDNDGDLDLFSPTFSQNKLFDNNGDGTFTNNSAEIISNDVTVESYGGAWADYDNDGDLDLFVPTGFGNSNDFLYKNNTSGRNWIKLHLTGITSNRDAIGARVYVKAVINGVSKWQMREVTANTTRGGESGGASGHVVHFGLNTASIIDSLKIVWPASGIVQKFANVTPNRFLEITENSNAISFSKSCKPDLPVTNPGFVTGKLFSDVNNNCVYDAGIDHPIANKVVRALPGTFYAFSDNNGDYTISLPAGTYSISQNPQADNWTLRPCITSNAYIVSVSPGVSSPGKNFPNVANIIPCSGSYSVTINSIGIDPGNCPSGTNVISPCPGNYLRYCFHIQNLSTLPSAAGAVLSINFPAGFQSVSPVSSNITPYSTTPFGTNTMSVTLTNPLNASSSWDFCIDVLNTNPSASASYVTTADFNNPGTPGANLVVNGDFESFTTGIVAPVYTLRCPPAGMGVQQYCVGSNPPGSNLAWACTPNTGASFLYGNGTSAPGVSVWRQTVPVTPNTTYNYGAFYNNLNPPPFNSFDPNMEMSINGTPVSTILVPENPNVWIPSNTLWCSGNNTSAILTIKDNELNTTGNDFAIDDVTFREAIAAPAILTQTTSCACDPNDKTVSPAGCGVNGNVGKNQKLTYRIRFQNKGTGPAHNILLSDVLDSDLDVNTFQILSSSHTISSSQIMTDNNLIVKFDNIELPAEITSETASKGYLLFSISPKTGLADGTEIINQTGIYFDENEVVLTDVTKSTLYDKPLPEARFSYKHTCTSTGLSYDFTYTGGTPDNATYLWEFQGTSIATSSLKNPNNIVFNNTTGYKYVKLTINRNGCSDAVGDSIKIENPLSNNGKKITICHHGESITVNANALSAHLGHGDCVGSCNNNSNDDDDDSDDNKRKIKSNIDLEAVTVGISVNLIPNPSSEECAVYVSGIADVQSQLDILVYNYSGQLISNLYTGKGSEMNNQKIMLNTRTLAEGIYFVKTMCNGKVYIDKLVVIH